MEDNLKKMIFDILVSNYNDKVEIDKDFEEYLKEKKKNELLSLYLLYGYAGNNEYVVEDILKFERKRKSEIIKELVAFIDVEMLCILQFMNDKRLYEIKEIAKIKGVYEFNINSEQEFSLDTIKILKQLCFIFCKKNDNGIIMHMPDFIKKKINNLKGESYYSDYYDELILYSKGIANTYGAINIKDAYEIINKDIKIQFPKYDSIVKFVSDIELEPIYYSYKYQNLCDFNIRDEEIDYLKFNQKEIIKYNRKFYEDIANDDFIFNLKEYKEFRNFLKTFYDVDLNEDEFLRCEIINDYIDKSQINEIEARKNLDESIDNYFEVNEEERKQLIRYIEKIKFKMPNWILGGLIEGKDEIVKIGRNDLCFCGSGKKYKKCHGK